MFVGRFDYAIDSKGRLNFPAKFREGMGETFIVARWLDHCLAAFRPPSSREGGRAHCG